MADKPILFSAPMVRALLAGTKTQTRRVIDVPTSNSLHRSYLSETGNLYASFLPEWTPALHGGVTEARLRYAPGDRLWVKHGYDVMPVYFQPIPDYEKLYAAGTDGLIYRVDGPEPRALKGSPTNGDRYYSVSLSREGVWRTFAVHSLVAAAFYGPKPFDGAQVRHLDSDIYNNRPSNLCWGSHEENWSDRKAAKAGLGENHHNVKLSEVDVVAIRSSSASQRQLARQYGVAQSTIWAVKTGRNWEYGNPATPMHDLFKPWRSPIHMPRWASRLTLAVTDVRVQRVQDISSRDAEAEGVPPDQNMLRAISPSQSALSQR